MSDGGKDKKVPEKDSDGLGDLYNWEGERRKGGQSQPGDSESALRQDRRAVTPAAAGLGGFHVTQLLRERATASVIAKPGHLALGSSWKAVDKKERPSSLLERKIDGGHLGVQSLSGKVSCADPQEEGLRGTQMPHHFLPSSHAGPTLLKNSQSI